jgi:hypothetical protein
MTPEQRVEESARAIEAAFYKAVDAGTNAEGFIPIATAALASSEKLIAELEARIARKDAALVDLCNSWNCPNTLFTPQMPRIYKAARAALNDKPHD